MQESGYRVAVVGATGAVGTIILEKLRRSQLPVKEVVPFASKRSVGQDLPHVGRVLPLTTETIVGFDLALFSAGGATSGEWAPRFVEAGAIVIDNSSRWRTEPTVPLVVSEVNPDTLDNHRGIIANPNCAAIPLVMILKPLSDAVGLERVVVSTYQSTSGTGVRGVQELSEQTRAILAGQDFAEPEVYPHPIAFNIIAAAGNFAEDDDYTDEERKLIFETRKILELESLAVTVTCVRVPIVSCHSEAVNIATRQPLSAADCRTLLAEANGVVVIDDPSAHQYPTPRDAAGKDDVFVGRIRSDASHRSALNLWIVADNLLKGAATNAVQIAELLHTRDLIS